MEHTSVTSNEFDAILNILEGLYSSINTSSIGPIAIVIQNLRAGSDNSRPFS